jgi:threonine 3-dehydrogenase
MAFNDGWEVYVMKQLVKISAGYGGFALRDTDIRRPRRGEALVRVKSAAICGTDLHIYEWNSWAQGLYAEKLPMPLGHEFCGEIVALGEGVERFSIGDRVCAETHLACGTCWQCMQGKPHICENLLLFSESGSGCFSEYTTVPVGFLVKVPEFCSDAEGALLEPFGVAVRAVQTAEISGRTVLIQGCGPIGLMAIPVARALGASRVFAVETEPYRIALAEALGVDMMFNPTQQDVVAAVKEQTGGVGVAAILELTGNIDAIEIGMQCIAKGGDYIFIGLPSKKLSMDVSRHLIIREIVLKGCYGRLIPHTWHSVFNLLKNQKVDILRSVTHRLTLEEYEKAFALSVSRQSGKILFENR